MNVVIIDGQGGQLGAQLVKEITAKFPDITVTAIGTNAVATATMLKAGAKNAATGENPVMSKFFEYVQRLTLRRRLKKRIAAVNDRSAVQ